ncbi:hypothetical protein WR25_09828 isoform C [Diploscapter pachys]|nr:hypothetical protein WR25_09828 isoform B [Diploscapter pachys]PAV85391.1 hypothetical protein WR25_09828 isoform C [Diploscapter pachys]
MGGIYRATFTEDFEYSFFNKTIGQMQDGRSKGYNFTQVFRLEVMSEQLETRVEFYTDFSPIAISNGWPRSGIQPMAVCIADTSYPDAISFTKNRVYKRQSEYPRDQKQGSGVTIAPPSYGDRQQMLNSNYYWTYESQGDDEDIEQYVNQTVCHSCTYRENNYNSNGFFDRIEGSGQIALVWRQGYYREGTYPSPIASDLGYKCSAAAPRRRFSTTTDYVSTRNNYYNQRSSSRAIEISYELKKKILRDAPKNNIDLIYEGDSLTLTCAVPNDQNWSVEWRKDSRDGRRVLSYETVNRSQRKFSIEIRSLKVSDSGSYYCFDDNEKTGANGTYERQAVATLRVQPVVPPFLSKKIIERQFESNFTLECPLIGSPVPYYKWYFNGEAYKNSWKTRYLTELSPDGRSIHFKMYRSWLEGTWTCMAFNGNHNAKFEFAVLSNEYLPEDYMSWRIATALIAIVIIIFVFAIIIGVFKLIAAIIRAIIRLVKRIKRTGVLCYRAISDYLDESYFREKRLLEKDEDEDEEMGKSQENTIDLPNSAVISQES